MNIEWVQRRLHECQQILDELLAAPKLSFDDELRSKLPQKGGLYAIYCNGAPGGDILRAGRTSGLRQRIYQNHLMGNQKGNLRSQLIADRACTDFGHAKDWVRKNCSVQVRVVEDERLREWAEYFMLAILRPKYCGEKQSSLGDDQHPE